MSSFLLFGTTKRRAAAAGGGSGGGGGGFVAGWMLQGRGCLSRPGYLIKGELVKCVENGAGGRGGLFFSLCKKKKTSKSARAIARTSERRQMCAAPLCSFFPFFFFQASIAHRPVMTAAEMEREQPGLLKRSWKNTL